MVSVIIRNKNESNDLKFILNLLTTRYKKDIKEIIIVDNNSSDDSIAIAKKFGCIVETINDFGFGRALNIGMSKATSNIVVSFSPYCYPINQDFFKITEDAFKLNSKLAGVRFLQNNTDFRNFIAGINAVENLGYCGLASSGSAIRKDIWEQSDMKYHNTMPGEDKNWTIKALNKSYEIKFVESFVCYYKKRSDRGWYNRYKQEHMCNDMLYGYKISFGLSLKILTIQIAHSFKVFIKYNYYAIKKFFFHLSYKYTGKISDILQPPK